MTPKKDILGSKLVEYRINEVNYDGGNLKGMSSQRLFQNINSIFKEFMDIIFKKYHY